MLESNLAVVRLDLWFIWSVMWFHLQFVSCLTDNMQLLFYWTLQGWALNKLPNLKSFLKDGEAESYKNVQVNFVAGKKAIMTIYEGESSDVWEDGMVEKEKVVLSDYKTKVRRMLWNSYVECNNRFWMSVKYIYIWYEDTNLTLVSWYRRRCMH